MNLKKLFVTAIAGLSLFAVAGTASADTNIYGASAQYILWDSIGGDFLTSKGCTPTGHARATGPDGAKHAIWRANCPGQGTVYLRISAKASYDGICACNNNFVNVPPYGPAGNPNCSAGCDGDNHKRMMIRPSDCTFPALPAVGSCTGVNDCVPVTIAAADIPPECITQQSAGQLKGPLCGGYTTRNFAQNPISSGGLPSCSPLVVPFAFFVNDEVTKGSATIDSLTSMQIKLIFSGAIINWAQLIDENLNRFDNKYVQVCLRHAGSGTHATLDCMEMAEFPLITQEVITGTPTCPTVYGDASFVNFFFNDGSSDMMKCINGSGNWPTTAAAIGYADADQNLTSYPNVVMIAENNRLPSRQTIAMNEYFFWSEQKLYNCNDNFFSDICTFAGLPANITNTYWTPSCMLEYSRPDPCSPNATPVTPTCPGPWYAAY